MKSEVAAGTFCSSQNTSACSLVFGTSPVGTKKVGESCEVASDCAHASEGLVTCDLQSKTCKALLEVGATCNFSSDCVGSAYCDDSKYVCTARVAAGATCTGSNSNECVNGYYCAAGSSRCTAQLANGAACTTALECESSYCSSGTCKDNGLATFGLAMLCA
jgi:hypothetical protein